MKISEIKTRGKISNMACDIGSVSISAETYVEHEPSVPLGLLKALGLTSNSVALPSEDTITFAKNASAELISTLADHEIDDISYIVGATETIKDGALPISNHILDLLPVDHLDHDIVSTESKHACIAAMNSLWQNVADPGIVVASDIATYGKNAAPSANFTGGAGSVAMATGEYGQLLEILNVRGASARLTYDFYKPYSVEGEDLIAKTYPTVFGQYSNIANYERVGKAYQSLKKKVEITLDDFAGIVFHTPYPGITKKNLAYLVLLDHEEEYGHHEFMDEIRELERKAHEAFANRDFGLIKDYERDIKNLLKEVSLWKGFAKYYDKLKPSLKHISQVGNIYTGSSPLCMMSLLENTDLKAGSRILWFGYGSGNQAIAMIARTTEHTNKIAAEWRTREKLNERIELTADEYSRLSVLKIHPTGYFMDGVDEYGIRNYEILKTEEILTKFLTNSQIFA